MDCKTARNFSIVEMLKKLGHHPIKSIGNDSWYNSPFRKEIHPSFKVSIKLNRWYDHGEGVGGNIIDLIQKMKNISIPETLIYFEKTKCSFPFQKQVSLLAFTEKNKAYQIIKIKKLVNKILIDYLISRNIIIEVAKKYCEEIYYSMHNKKYFAIAFRNISNGIETRNKYFKGCLGKKDISLIKNNSKTVYVFEGFIDFLSYLSSNLNDGKNKDFIILNSISLLSKLDTIIKNYNEVFAFLDNDKSGKLGVVKLRTIHKNIIDMSYKYKKHKDVNEYLMNENIHTVRT